MIIKKICIGMIGILGFVLLMSGYWKLTEYSKVKAREREEQEEQLAKQEEEEAGRVAEEYISGYANRLQSKMYSETLADLIVTYEEISREDYAAEFGVESYELADYCYYYVFNYVSDSIETVYYQMTKDGDYTEFIDMMNQMRRAKLSVENEYDSWKTYETEFQGKTIKVYVNDHIHSRNDMSVKDTVGKVYELTQNANGIWVWVDGQKMYDQAKVNNSNSYTSSSSSKYSESSGTYSLLYSDPYDVYDYDDPDDFAEEWAEEFGDDYDDGYDEAYDYWEDEWD